MVIFCDFNFVKFEVSVKIVIYRNFKLVNIEFFKSDFINLVLCNENIVNLSLDDFVSCYNLIFLLFIEFYVFLKSKIVVNRFCVFWFNDWIKVVIRERRKVEWKWRVIKDLMYYFVFK